LVVLVDIKFHLLLIFFTFTLYEKERTSLPKTLKLGSIPSPGFSAAVILPLTLIEALLAISIVSQLLKSVAEKEPL